MKASIIVPIYNAERNLVKLVNSLISQNFDGEYEILLVDNNSTDSSLKMIQNFAKRESKISVFKEKDIQSSYAARNKGLKFAEGEIIAFTDSDCVVENDWLKKGVETLEKEDADLVGGYVKFDFKNKNSVSELYDSVTNMDNEKSVNLRKVAKTANLFVKKKVFQEIGFFNEKVKSGGDVEWTKKATDSGFKLVFAKDSVVHHPTRNFNQLLKKHFRVGTGYYYDLKKRKRNRVIRVLIYIKNFFPPSKKLVKGIYNEIRSKYNTKPNYTHLWLIVYLNKIAKALGVISVSLNMDGKVR